MSTWTILKKIAGNKARELGNLLSSGKELERIDKNLPLGLRFGALVVIPETDFILGADNGLKVVYPKGKGIVTAYGTFKLDPFVIHRFYLTFEDDQVYVLQVVIDGDGTVEECKLLMPWDEVYPPDDDDEERTKTKAFWDYWLSDQDGYIGYSVFQSNDKTLYSRTWEHTGPGFVIARADDESDIDRKPPVSFVEILYLDRFGQKTERVEYTGMMYGRQVNDDVDEYLLVAVVEDSEGAAVRLQVGVDLNPAALTII